MSTDDAQALQRWIDHRDGEAFRNLVQRYATMVYATGRRVLANDADAEDVAQECFQTLATVDRLPAHHLGAWLHRVATNLALNKVRGESRRRARDDRYAAQTAQATEPTWDDIYRHVDEAIAQLPEKLRAPLVANYLEGQTHVAIAKAQGIARQTVTNRVHKGVEEIRRHLRRKGIEVGGGALAALFTTNLASASAAPASLVAGLGKIALSGASANASTAALGTATSAGFAVKAAAALVLTTGVVLFALAWTESSDGPTSSLIPIQSEDSEAVQSTPGETEPHASTAPSSQPSNPALAALLESNATGPGVITGVVRDSSGVPVDGVVVRLIGAPNAEWYDRESEFVRKSTATNAGGSFQFDGLPAPSENVQTPYTLHAVARDRMAMGPVGLTLDGPYRSIELTLEPSIDIAGRVLLPNGAPAAGARVYPIATSNERLGKTSVATALMNVTDADGTFVFKAFPEGEYRLVAALEGYGTAEAIARTGTSDPSLSLSVGGAARGRVVDADTGAPLPGVTLFAATTAPGKTYVTFTPFSAHIAETDATGAYTFSALAPGEYHVSTTSSIEDVFLRTPRGASSHYTKVTDESVSALEDIVLARGGELHGQVLDPITGKGVPGIPITLMVDRTVAPLPPRARMVSGLDGHFRYTGLPAGEHIIAPFGNSSIGKIVQSRDGEILREVTLEYSQNQVIAGVARYADGTPAENAVLKVAGVNNHNVPLAITGKGGGFRLGGLALASQVNVRAETKDWASAWTPHTFQEDVPGRLDLTLDQPLTGAIAGIAVDASGRPLTEEPILVNPEDTEGILGFHAANTDDDGRFEITRLAPGSYRVSLANDQSNRAGVVILVAPGKTVHDVRLSATTARTGVIHGIVLDVNGTPLEHVYVSHNGAGVATNTKEDGTFTLHNLEPSQYRIAFNHPSYTTETLEAVPVGKSNLEVRLRPRGAIAGRVIHAESGDPIPEFQITAARGQVHHTRDASFREPKHVRHHDGTFLLEDIEADETTVRVTARGFQPTLTQIAVAPSDTADGLEIRMQPGALIAGFVRDTGGAPIAGAELFFDDAPSRSLHRGKPLAVTDANGAFTLDAIPLDVTRLAARHDDYAVGGTAYTYGDTEATITLEAPCTVRGTVRNSDLHDVMVRLLPARSGDDRLQTHTTWLEIGGPFEFSHVAPGAYILTARYGAGLAQLRSISKKVSVGSGKSTESDLHFPAATAALEGYVKIPDQSDGDIWVHASISNSDGEYAAAAKCDGNAFYTLDALPSGNASLTASIRDGIQLLATRATATLTAGSVTRADIAYDGTGILYGTIDGLAADEQATLLLLNGDHVADIPSANALANLDVEWSARGRVAEDGTFQITGLDAGEYTGVVVASPADKLGINFHRFAVFLITVDANASTEVHLPAP